MIKSSVTINKNWMKIFHEMETLFESWKKRKLTIFGKCTIINTLAISKLIYVASILEIPDNDFIKNIKRLIFNFMWNKTDRIKRNTIIGEVYEGGIGLVDIESKFTALKAMWIPRLLSTEHNIKHFFNSFCKATKIDIEYLMNTNETVAKDYGIINNFPEFYKQAFVCYNLCKDDTQTKIPAFSTESFLLQPIWSNKVFNFKGKTICFENWIKSGILYVKDIFEESGTLKSSSDIFDTLRKRTNWLCEYKIIKQIFTKFELKYDFSKIPYLQTKQIPIISHQHNTKTFYSRLIKRRFQAPCTQSKLEKEFKLESKNAWKSIYTQKIKNTKDKALAEFNYKLLNNLLCNNLLVSKWNKNITAKCKHCNEIENSKHLIFDCVNVEKIWKAASECLNFDIKWKNIVVGFYLEETQVTKLYNYFLSFIAYRIYKCKMYCRLENLPESILLIKNSFKEYLTTHCAVLTKLKNTKENELFQLLIAKL